MLISLSKLNQKNQQEETKPLFQFNDFFGIDTSVDMGMAKHLSEAEMISIVTEITSSWDKMSEAIFDEVFEKDNDETIFKFSYPYFNRIVGKEEYISGTLFLNSSKKSYFYFTGHGENTLSRKTLHLEAVKKTVSA